MVIKVDELLKSRNLDGKVKSFGFKARKSLGERRTYRYAAMTKDAAQRRKWTFYEAVKVYTICANILNMLNTSKNVNFNLNLN